MPVAILMVIFSDLRMIPVTRSPGECDLQSRLSQSKVCAISISDIYGFLILNHLPFMFLSVYLSFLLMKHLKLITCHMNIWLVVRIAQEHFI